MECSKCGGKTKVIGTRSPLKPGKGAEVKKAEKVVSWYTSEFTVRLRKCTQCGAKALTVVADDTGHLVQVQGQGGAALAGWNCCTLCFG